ncbi:MAG: GIY-YIG nuclease family protein [Rhizobiales bacterium]|nr:GIY-YIG nuclease family protein [Hyphomicrobiales bacterium]
MDRTYFVYVIASKRNGTLYIGVTSDLARRMEQHKARVGAGFAARHGVDRLVYFERFSEVNEAIAREKQLKGWNRAWKVSMIERGNPEWREIDTF